MGEAQSWTPWNCVGYTNHKNAPIIWMYHQEIPILNLVISGRTKQFLGCTNQQSTITFMWFQDAPTIRTGLWQAAQNAAAKLSFNRLQQHMIGDTQCNRCFTSRNSIEGLWKYWNLPPSYHCDWNFSIFKPIKRCPQTITFLVVLNTMWVTLIRNRSAWFLPINPQCMESFDHMCMII